MVCCPQVFPDALFHQLLLAMSHADCETRVEAHKIFSVLLLRTLRLPWSDQYDETSDSCQSLESLKDVDDGIKVYDINWPFFFLMDFSVFDGELTIMCFNSRYVHSD